MVQDWGGAIGLGMAGRRPELVKALVVGDTWAWPKDADRHARWFSAVMGGPIGRFLGLRFNAIPHGGTSPPRSGATEPIGWVHTRTHAGY